VNSAARILTACLLLAGSGCSDAPTTQASAPSQAVAAQQAREQATAQLHAWVDERFAEELSFFPLRKAFYGIKDEDAGRVGDLTEQGLDEVLTWRRRTAAQLQSLFDYDALSPTGQDTYDLWMYVTERAEAERRHIANQYVFNQNSGVARSLPQLLISWHQVDNLQDLEDYISRISAAAVAVEQLIVRARLYADGGVHPPYFAFDIVAREARALSSGRPFDASDRDNPIWADFKSEVAKLQTAGAVTDLQAAQLTSRAEDALLESWGPAYQALQEWLELDRENAADPALGSSGLPNGLEYYAERLAYHSTTDMTPDEVHEVGLKNVERLMADLQAIRREVGFEGTLQEFFTLMRESKDDRRFYYSNDDAGRQAYIEESTLLLDNMKANLPRLFGLLPKADLVVKRVEAYREQPGAAQHYNASSPDGSRPGVYYAHLIDMTSMPRYQLESVAYHEGVPGHHMQIAIANELQGVPDFRKRARMTAFSEGWALYAEGLAKEIPGTYADPYSEVGRLNDEIWRAVRLVVDTGLHAKGWSEQQAIDYMMQNTMNTAGQSQSEIRRYITTPGQATGYMLGTLKIRELRSRAEQALGERFDIRAFHDTVLDSGPLPLWMLERKIDRWIASY